MSDTFKMLGVIVLVVAFIGFGIWRWTARLDDCQQMGHGLAYCIFVWGK